MNEAKFINGLKEVNRMLTWNVIFLMIPYLVVLLVYRYSSFLWLWIALGCVIARSILASFISGYEKG